MRDGLLARNCDVLIAPDGESALTVLKQRRVDAVVAGVELQGMSGLQLARAITRVYPHMPVLMAAKNPEPGLAAKVLGSGATDLVSESASAEEIHGMILKNLERRAALSKRLLTDRAEVLVKAIRAIVSAIDAKSLHASKHSGRVTQLCLMVGERMSLSSQEMATLELAAQLHDVGKIGTPDAVLSKPDVLTDEEWVDVLKHPALSGAFLAAVPELGEVATIARHHHEHVDGTGYPDGLQGEAIPLLSKILAVADAYEAMTSERPYRHALSHEQAISELRSHCGTQFDADAVGHLVAALSAAAERKAA
jgi:HD-GYP domain-containing protein (c-di-GMP phosphodiesterase class II)